ncbi:MAG: polyphosphate polymerase domain-containing protein [Clostridia bacterium]|nr:polyphosphate polymerase domain-containing protein [Clostridia bacterium]
MRDVERFESKYRTDHMETLLVRKRLERYIQPDEFSGKNGYLVRSVYFDTIYNKDFYDREQSLTYRGHIRLRTYPENPGTVSLEYKQKNGVTIRKRILSVSREEAERLLSSDYSFLAQHKEAFGRLMYRILTMETYRPAVMIEYRRMAYARVENSTRITFDTSIRACESNMDLFGIGTGMAPVGPQGQVIMELKYTDFFMSDLKTAIGSHLLRQEAAGKYQRSRMIFMSGRNIL